MGPQGPGLAVADVAPTLTQGALWFNSVDTQLYVGYVDPNSSQWVVANNLSAGITAPMTVPYGGTGATTLTGVLIGNGASAFTAQAPLGVANGGTGATTGAIGPYLPLVGGTLTGPGNLSVDGYLTVSGASNLVGVVTGSNAIITSGANGAFRFYDRGGSGNYWHWYTYGNGPANLYHNVGGQVFAASQAGDITIKGTYLYFQNTSGLVNGSGGPFIFADANNIVLHQGSGNGHWWFQDKNGVNAVAAYADGQLQATNLIKTSGTNGGFWFDSRDGSSPAAFLWYGSQGSVGLWNINDGDFLRIVGPTNGGLGAILATCPSIRSDNNNLVLNAKSGGQVFLGWDVAADVNFGNQAILKNGLALWGLDTGGTKRTLAYISVDNLAIFGSSNSSLRFLNTGTATFDGFGYFSVSGIQYSGPSSTANWFKFGYSNIVAGLVSVAVDNGGAAYALANASDCRMKDEIAPSTYDCLDAVLKMPIRQFKWRKMADPTDLTALPAEDAKLVRAGVVAQELYEIFPEGVIAGDDTTDKLGQVWQLEQNVLIAALIGSVQQLHARQEELNGRYR
jgi:Chaperone of endosialidase